MDRVYELTQPIAAFAVACEVVIATTLSSLPLGPKLRRAGGGQGIDEIVGPHAHTDLHESCFMGFSWRNWKNGNGNDLNAKWADTRPPQCQGRRCLGKHYGRTYSRSFTMDVLVFLFFFFFLLTLLWAGLWVSGGESWPPFL